MDPPACFSLCSALHDATQARTRTRVFVKCLRTLTRMSECMCDTVLPECHTENWVWLVLQAKASHSLFSIKPNGGGNSSRCNSSVLGFHCSPLAFTFMNPAAILGCFRHKRTQYCKVRSSCKPVNEFMVLDVCCLLTRCGGSSLLTFTTYSII